METEYVYDEAVELDRRLRDQFHIRDFEEIVAVNLKRKTIFTYGKDGLAWMYREEKDGSIRIKEIPKRFFETKFLSWQSEQNKNNGEPIHI